MFKICSGIFPYTLDVFVHDPSKSTQVSSQGQLLATMFGTVHATAPQQTHIQSACGKLEDLFSEVGGCQNLDRQDLLGLYTAHIYLSL